jgi:hypothetical protein
MLSTPETRTVKLYRSPELPGQWIGNDSEGALVRWPDEPGGWAKRTPYTGGKRQLEEVEPALARGTRWPGAGRAPRPRDPAGMRSDTQIGLRATKQERAKWERAAEVHEQSLTTWARDELNTAADRTLEGNAAPRSKNKP